MYKLPKFASNNKYWQILNRLIVETALVALGVAVNYLRTIGLVICVANPTSRNTGQRLFMVVGCTV